MAEQHGTRRGRGSVYWNASLVAEGRGDYAEARRLTERAIAYLSESEPTRDIPRLRLHYGWLLLRANPPEPVGALEQFGAAMDGLVNVGTELELGRCMFESGRAHLLLGDARLAEELARASLERIGDSGDFDACDAHIVLGDALAVSGRLDEALGEYRWAADRLAMLSAGRQSASVWRSLGDRLLNLGDPAGAARAYATALEEAGIRPTTFSMTTRQPLTVGFSDPTET
jgi:tetratricopeptide (TPR) repeat protein